DRPVRQHHRGVGGSRARPVRHRHAGEIRIGYRSRASERGDRHSGSCNRPRDVDRAPQHERHRGRDARRGPRGAGTELITIMSDLFSQPFEEGRPPAPLERRVMSVSELTASIRAVIESSFLDLWVEGEISNCRIWHTGHAYFTLKDSGTQIKAVLFRGASRYLRFNLEDGLHVIARGKL